VETEHLSLWALYEGNLEGGSFNGDSGGCVEGPRWGAGGLHTGD